MSDEKKASPFDEETWAQLPSLLENLPEKVHLHIWGDPVLGASEREAVRICEALSERFDKLAYRLFPRRINYPYYPVIGVMGEEGGETADFNVRLIGLPKGFQITSLITAIQAVSFQGMTLEATSRIRLSRLKTAVDVQLITADDNEGGPILAQPLFSMAVVNPMLRVFLIMANEFPEVVYRYSLKTLPHLIINGRYHHSGVLSETDILQHIAKALQPE